MDKDNKGKKCFCGHYKNDHEKYAFRGMGHEKARNLKGSKYVCTKNGCSQWNLCDL